MRNCQPGVYCAGVGRRVAEADLRHVSVSDHRTSDIRETCTYNPFLKFIDHEYEPNRGGLLGFRSAVGVFKYNRYA